MWRNGTVVVATSNRRPNELYENGLNRHYFMPFIATLERQCKLHDMDSQLDHRMLMTTNTMGQSKYIVIGKDGEDGEDGEGGEDGEDGEDGKGAAKAQSMLDKLFETFKAMEHQEECAEGAVVTVPTAFGRTLQVPSNDCFGGLVRFHFDDLFKTDLGAADYRALAQRFHTIVVYDIPLMNHK